MAHEETDPLGPSSWVGIHDFPPPCPTNDIHECPSPSSSEKQLQFFIITLLQYLVGESAVELLLLLILGRL